jgi:ATP-dependent DNA ligase
MLYALNLLELDGEELRSLSLSARKKRLARLLGKRPVTPVKWRPYFPPRGRRPR